MNIPNATRTSKKCCFCIPLRSGLMAAGCLNSILDISLLFLLCHHILQLYYMYSSHWFPLLETIISALTAMLYVNDLIFNMIFLYGCYKKDSVKLRVFIRYNVVYVILNMFMIFYFLLELFYFRNKWDVRRLVILIVIGLWTIYNLFTIYLTSRLIRSEKKKIENNMQREAYANDAQALTTITEDVEQPITILDENVDIY